MPRYRICRSFVVESGHMLSKHPERCRFPHGHTRRIEIVVSSPQLDENDMVLDFKALKLAVEDFIEQFDHSMAVNSADPLLPAMEQTHPGCLVVFEGTDPTTEVLAKVIYDYVEGVLSTGTGGERYSIPAGKATLERVRVWETPSSWAEFGD